MLKNVDRRFYVFKTSKIDTRFEIFAMVLIKTDGILEVLTKALINTKVFSN